MKSAGPGQADHDYREGVRVSGKAIGVLGLVLGVTAGALTGVAIRNFVGDEPIIAGGNAAVFYITFALASIIDLFVLVNFTVLSLRVSDSGFEFNYGVFEKKFTWPQIESVERRQHRWVTHGSWGIRWSSQGRRAWSQPGVSEGILVRVREKGKARSYFVSSRRPEELERALREGVAAHGRPD